MNKIPRLASRSCICAFSILSILLLCCPEMTSAQLTLRPDVKIPELPGFRPLPARNDTLTSAIEKIVFETGFSEHVSAAKSPDKREEWASICIVDLTDISKPVLAGWEETHLTYPASAYKMYVLGEAIRQVCAGERSLDDPTSVAKHNWRTDSRLTSGQVLPLSEVLRIMCQYSDNSAANVAIDVVDRQRASALLRAMGCSGSDITRKYLARSLEDDGYSSAPSTQSSALHFATFLWATETGAIGGGRGRGLIKAYLSMNEDFMRPGLPVSATVYNKTGYWDIFNGEAALIEDGPVRYISCVLAAMPREQFEPQIADFARRVHALIKSRH